MYGNREGYHKRALIFGNIVMSLSKTQTCFLIFEQNYKNSDIFQQRITFL